MASESRSADVERAGRAALADELYELRCALVGQGERFYTAAREEEMRRRAAVLEPLVGADLDKLLAAED
jgi:hypothetical protein